MSDDMLNKKIGRYEIQEVLGEGAMAVVYRAYDPEINRSLACKILKAEHCVDDEYTSRFLREGKAAGALSHASIVTIYDVGEIDGRPYIMMELVDGANLGEVLLERKKFSVIETITIALQLAKALDYAHAANIIHRDIKPDNIILLQNNETVKVADFGIARMNESEEVQKTQVGAVLGTPRYMSPEQALGEKVDNRSDLFSVGTIMYEMLTGKKAFDAKNMGTLMMQISNAQPQPLKSVDSSIPAGVRQIIQKLLQKSPDKRYQTGGELAKALIAELKVLQDQNEEKEKHKYIPLQLKLTISAVAIVTLVLAISTHVLFGMLSAAMTKQAVDSGSSFAKFIANETAVPLLSEDWITLETFINDAASRDTFAYLIVADRNNVIRGASDADLVGQVYQETNDVELINATEEVQTTSSVLDNGEEVFNITAPVLFQNTEVGKIVLGLSQDSLNAVKRVSSYLMLILSIITISSVAAIMFVFGGLVSKPMRAISKALLQFKEGDLDARISLSRSDEIGKVFEAFNSMANAVQKRYTKVADELEASSLNAVDQLQSKETTETELDKSLSEIKDKAHPNLPEAAPEAVPEESDEDFLDDATIVQEFSKTGSDDSKRKAGVVKD